MQVAGCFVGQSVHAAPFGRATEADATCTGLRYLILLPSQRWVCRLPGKGSRCSRGHFTTGGTISPPACGTSSRCAIHEIEGRRRAMTAASHRLQVRWRSREGAVIRAVAPLPAELQGAVPGPGHLLGKLHRGAAGRPVRRHPRAGHQLRLRPHPCQVLPPCCTDRRLQAGCSARVGSRCYGRIVLQGILCPRPAACCEQHLIEVIRFE